MPNGRQAAEHFVVFRPSSLLKYSAGLHGIVWTHLQN